MHILIMTGSPHKKGTSCLLAEQLAQGASAAGHTVSWADTAFMNIKSCLGCNYCRATGNPCIQQDDFHAVVSDLLKADLVVFATPLYYFGMTAHLKAAIDRFYSINGALREQPKKAMLLCTCADTDEDAVRALKLHYETMLRYLRWEDAGTLFALGMAAREDIEASDYPKQACRLGETL